MNSIKEHEVSAVVTGVHDLGLGSNRPSPICSGPSANRSCSNATSIADGCRCMRLVNVDEGDEEAETGEKREERSDDGIWE